MLELSKRAVRVRVLHVRTCVGVRLENRGQLIY